MLNSHFKNRPHNILSQKQALTSIILLNVNDAFTYTNIKKVLPETNEIFLFSFFNFLQNAITHWFYS